MDIRKVKKLIEMMEESDISEIEIKEGEESVRISRSVSGRYAPVSEVRPVPADDTPVVKPTRKPSGHVLTAPMVGTFYRCPSPGSPSFVEVGDRIKQGQVVCIIESMKMMNQITADRGGQVEAILVGNEQAVEFDQPLMTIV